MAEPSGRAPGDKGVAHRSGRGVAWLLVLPLIGTLVPEIYNRSTPSIGGMPFFYWYQLAWIAGSVACTWVVYRATRGAR
jgi:hypothetical protein